MQGAVLTARAVFGECGAGSVGSGVAAQLSRRTFHWIVYALLFYVAATLAVLPFAGEQGPAIHAITPILVAVVLTAELTTSFLLFMRFRDERGWSLLLLGCAYLYAALMAVVHLLTFPGAVLSDRIVIGSAQSTTWAFLFWMGGYAVLTLSPVAAEAFAAGRRVAPDATARAVAAAVSAVVAAVLCCILAATVLVGWIPTVTLGASWTPLNAALTLVPMAIMAASVLLIFLFAKRNALFLWLSLALTAVLSANVLGLAGGARYSVGWSAGRLSWMLSASVLFLFFMGQFARQQRLLAQARNTLERRVAERTADLATTVRQRDLLLREVYHRVKNNLQIVDSLLNMEARRVGDAGAQEAFQRLRTRVYTLGLVHQQLMSSDNLETFSIVPFLRELSDNLTTSLALAERGIALSVDAEPVAVDLDFAIPVGLITTELIFNAVKHANASRVAVEFRRTGQGAALLSVVDDGAEEGAGPRDRKAGGVAGIGSRIVAGLAQQLGGRIEVSQRDGMRVEIRMPLPKAA